MSHSLGPLRTSQAKLLGLLQVEVRRKKASLPPKRNYSAHGVTGNSILELYSQYLPRILIKK
jgi:hypothetical protein